MMSTVDLTFSANTSDGYRQCIDIMIIDDSAVEGNETFSVILTTSEPNVLIETNSTEITIADNDVYSEQIKLSVNYYFGTLVAI